MRALGSALESLPWLARQLVVGTPPEFRKICTTAVAELRKPPVSVINPAGAEESSRQESGHELETGAAPESMSSRDTQPDLVDKVLAKDLMSSSERLKVRLKEIGRDFQRAEGDTGSPEVQAALLTERISHMTWHLQTHRKDFASKRGLTAMLSRRRKLLQYLRRSDFDAYTVALVRLGLKDNFAKKDRLTIRQ